MPRDDHVLCMHCQQYMSRTRERAHRARHQAPLYSPPPRVPSRLRRVFDIDVESEQEADQASNQSEGDNQDGKYRSPFTDGLTLISHSVASASLNVIQAAQNSICARWNCSIDPVDSDAGDEGTSDVLAQAEGDTEEDVFDWDKFESGAGLSAWDKLGEDYERDAARVGASPLQTNLWDPSH